MKKYRLKEFLAVVGTVAGLIILPITIFSNAPWTENEEGRVIHLTAIMEKGLWTAEKVNGLNYWWKDFKPATLVLEQGKKVLLRLSSADVTHTFFMPELYPEPIKVKAGFTVELSIIPENSGEFTYYCTTVCGECHYSMNGKIIVYSKSESIPNLMDKNELAFTCSDDHGELTNFTSIVDFGEHLYASKGCASCHGQGGLGGVYNPNYINKYVPELNTLAERMKIYWEEDADVMVNIMERGISLKTLESNPPIENFNRFLAQYNSIRDKIREGSPNVQKLDREGPEPPLVMPSWKHVLSDNDVDAVIAYLISQFPWAQYD